MRKIIFILTSFFLGGSIIFGFNSPVNFIAETKIVDVLGRDIFLDSDTLNSTIVVVSSPRDISDHYFSGSCMNETNFLNSKGSNYYFYFKVLDRDCDEPLFYLRNDEMTYFGVFFRLDLHKKFDLLNSYLDIDDVGLEKILKHFEFNISEAEIFNGDIRSLIKNIRGVNVLRYNMDIINSILEKRKNKYTIPVYGADLPVLNHKLPNSPRPYRASYTYGIHEGWDIDVEFGDEVISIDDGIVIRTVEGFLFEDLGQIVRGNNLTHKQKLLNLDILRGNQIWIKTMKGDIVFYAHLEDIYDNIKPGAMVKRGQPLATVGISGVPDENYNDYHLHFELRKNPFNKSKIGNNTYIDYMNWNWYFHDKTINYIRQNQYNIFYKN